MITIYDKYIGVIFIDCNVRRACAFKKCALNKGNEVPAIHTKYNKNRKSVTVVCNSFKELSGEQ